MISGIPDKNDVIADIYSMLISYYDDADKLRELLAIIGAEIQQLEDISHQCMTDRLLSTAIGQQLDQWGRKIGISRQGDTDEIFKIKIYVQILINISGGASGDLQEILSKITQVDTILYHQTGTAHSTYQYETVASGVAQWQRDHIEYALPLASPAGTSWHVVEGTTGQTLILDNGPGLDEGQLGTLITQQDD
jgi:hypothetical protein